MRIDCTDCRFTQGVQILNGFLAERLENRFSSVSAAQGQFDGATLKDGGLKITYTTLNNAYLTLGKALTQTERGYTFTVKKRISDTGIMLDCARNAVIKVSQAKRMIAIGALLGFNYFELYVEDCLEVDGEPYFGYMRGRFTQDEIRELDSFSKLFGVELVPCIQTLAHLERLFFHWREYTASICDKRDVLLVDEPRTYTLLENVIKTCRKCFASSRINIGMDEAFDAGLGQHLVKHGYEPRGQIVKRHLKKVVEICERYQFTPSLWADMFYDDMKKGEYGGIPKNVELIYWDYGIDTTGAVGEMLSCMKPSGTKVSFAGGVNKWCGFSPYNRYSSLAVDSTIDRLVDEGIGTYLMTAWGDDGGEAAQFSVLPTLCHFAEKNIAETEAYANGICKAITNYSYEEFCALDDVNYLNDEHDYSKLYNPCKYLLYADPLIGVEEIAALPDYPARYGKISKKLKELADRESEYNYLFKTMYALSRVLELKSYLIEELYYAYREKNVQALRSLTEKIKKTVRRMDAFIDAYEKQWRRENKEFGFEIMQIRLYGVRGRLNDVGRRLKRYLDGSLEKIEELEETKYFYPLQNGEYRGGLYNLYVANVTYGKV